MKSLKENSVNFSELKVNDNLKVNLGNESVWVLITEINKTTIKAIVDNVPLFTDEHGYSLGDEIVLKRGK